DLFPRRPLLPRRRRHRLRRAQGVRSRRRQRQDRRGGDLHQRIRGEGGGATLMAARLLGRFIGPRANPGISSAHSRVSGNPGLKGWVPVFGGRKGGSTYKIFKSKLRYLPP